MLSCCFLRVENALWREPAEEILPVGGLEDRQDLDGGGEDGGGEGSETEAETEPWGQVINITIVFVPLFHEYVA